MPDDAFYNVVARMKKGQDECNPPALSAIFERRLKYVIYFP
jgi:hypothetical protein